MISNLVSFFISSRFQPAPIYEELAQQDGIHLPGPESRTQETQRRVIRVMRPATEIIEGAWSLQQAEEKTKGSTFRSWPVLNAAGVIGVLKAEELKRALASGEPGRTVSEVAISTDFPHLHVDHPLTLALERMGSTQLDVLPVVSRANIHELQGVVTLPDVLNCYGLGDSQNLARVKEENACDQSTRQRQ